MTRRALPWLLAAAGLAALWTAPAARAEYRAYELEVTDLYDCRVNEREDCRTHVVRTSFSPRLYVRTHGGPQRIGVVMLATWMCRGDTSFYEPVCPRPAPRDGRFSQGDTVRIALDKHVTQGWRGTVEVAYYQRSVRSNVYGVRFPERQNAYLRYFEKDLEPAASGEEAAGEEGQGGAPQSEPPQ